MRIVLLAEAAVLAERQFFLHFFLITLRVMSDAAAYRTLEFYHCIFNLSHIRRS